jgi:2-polyprenyl-3-methyl-5-hydroxy-6-metoxy-1,4-benzoquinol methylase
MKNKNCPICDSKNVKYHLCDTNNVWLNRYSINVCKECNCYFLNDFPTSKEIEHFYKNEYFNFSKIIQFIKGLFRRARTKNQFEFLLPYLSNKKSVMEIGCADGVLINSFKQMGLTVIGLEFSPKYKATAKKRYNIDLLDIDFMSFNQTVDAILMSHVIEHIPDINASMAKLYELLNEDGLLFLEVPNSPPFNHNDQNELREYLQTPHVYNFTLDSFEQLARKHNFEIIKLERNFYNISNGLNEKSLKDITHILIGGNLKRFKFNYTYNIITYMLRVIFAPNSAFKSINNKNQYISQGDNIRMLLKKKKL